MNGNYETKDGCIYAVFDQKIGKSIKTEKVAKCIKSTTRTVDIPPFRLVAGQLERNIKSGAWIKIEQ